MFMKQCKIGKIGLVTNDILLVDIDNNKEIGIEHIYEFKNIALDIAKDQNLYGIIDYGAYSLPTKEAREYCSNAIKGEVILGWALIVHDLGQMILTRHTIKRQRSNVPIRIFKDSKSAKKWLTNLSTKMYEKQRFTK